MRFGVHRQLEDEADRLIKESLRGVRSPSQKADILTPWKLARRQSREVLVPTGIPDPATRRGMIHRAMTTTSRLNSRDGLIPARRTGGGTYDSLTEHIARETGVRFDGDD